MIRLGPVKSTKNAEQNVTNALLIKRMLRQAVSLAALMESKFHGAVLRSIVSVLKDSRVAKLARYVDDIINEDLSHDGRKMPLKRLRCYAVREGKNGLLDIARKVFNEANQDIIELLARKVFNEANQDIIELVQRYSDEYNLHIKLQVRGSAKYFMTAPSSLLDGGLPKEFIDVETKKGICCFTSMRMVKCNERIATSASEIALLSDKYVPRMPAPMYAHLRRPFQEGQPLPSLHLPGRCIRIIFELLETVKANVHIFYKLSEALGLLDMLYGFAQLCTTIDCVRPEFAETTRVVNARHPVLVICGEDVVPNDIIVGPTRNFVALTGPNMSGKSTYVRMAAMVHIMAQVGCFVPADEASIRIHSQVFARLNHDDSLEFMASSFMAEMRDMAFTLHNFDDSSLVIIDELGRGTSVLEGTAIAAAILEAFLRSKGRK
ncbi:MutS protein msh4 [Spiromyces aspiralis]|uniref:MutS protein msh4 n=1 Tax=Spiromyces aspiralis TaxID=68401 RepID=A0ACC1HV00_9FUNG|nr:MutS protein msh4 [Spiromyces aspiralis]